MARRNNKISLWTLRLWLLRQNLSLAALARRLGKSRSAIYGALKTPQKYPRTLHLLKNEIGHS